MEFGRFEFALLGVVVILAFVAYRNYSTMGDSLKLTSGDLPSAAGGGFQAQAGFNSLTGRLQFGGGVKL